MNNDDDRPSSRAAMPPSGGAHDRHTGNPWSEPVYKSVLEASGLRPPPGQYENISKLRPGSPRPAPANATAKGGTRRFRANGRALRLLPGGRQADQAGRLEGSAPARTSPMEQDAEASYRLQLLLPPHDGDQPGYASGRPVGALVTWSDYQNWSEFGRASLSGHTDVGRYRPPGQHDQPGRYRQPGQHHQPGRFDQAGRRRYDQPGQPSRKNTDYLASAWEYAGARALATAGRHRRPDRERPRRAALTRGELRALWAAQHLSSAGDLFAQVAIAIGVYDQTRSPFLTALAYALTYLPPVLGGRLLGRLTADIPPHGVMIALDLARAGLVASMALAGLPVAGLCLLLLAVMLLAAPFSAARTALLQNAPPADRRPGSLSSIAMSWQCRQAFGFLLGAAAAVALQPRQVLLIDAATFLISAGLLSALVRHRRAGPPELRLASDTGVAGPDGTAVAGPDRTAVAGRAGTAVAGRARTAAGPGGTATGPGVTAILRSPVLRTLLLFSWLAGCYVVPEGLAVPYAHAVGGGPLTVGLLMAAMPAGAVAGIIAFTRATRPEAGTQLLGWLAMLCCMPLAFCSLRPPLWVVLILWALAGAGTAYQLVVAAAFSQAIRDDLRPGALGVAQSGLLAAQALGFVAAGAVAELIGPQAAVALAGLVGLIAATVLARLWDRRHERLVWASRARATVLRDRPAAW